MNDDGGKDEKTYLVEPGLDELHFDQTVGSGLPLQEFLDLFGQQSKLLEVDERCHHRRAAHSVLQLGRQAEGMHGNYLRGWRHNIEASILDLLSG